VAHEGHVLAHALHPRFGGLAREQGGQGLEGFVLAGHVEKLPGEIEPLGDGGRAVLVELHGGVDLETPRSARQEQQGGERVQP